VLNERLILPYAPLDASRKQPFTAEMELASIVSLAEAKRKKKGGILRGEPERILSISKLYYPLWLVPWENDYVTVDGMKVFSFETTYGKPPDYASFIANVEKNKKSYEQFMKLLKQDPKLFEDFASSEKIVIEGVIQDKEFQSAIFGYFKQEIASKESIVNESALLKERLKKEDALARVNEIIELWKKSQSNIEGLQKVVLILDDATKTLTEEFEKSIEEIKQEYESKIDKLRPIVEEKVSQLTTERNEKNKTVITAADKELETRMQEKSEYEKKLEALEQEKSSFEEKKNLAKLRKDEASMKSWKLRVNEREKRISELKKKIRKLQQHMDRTEKDKQKTLKQTNETYQAQIDAETAKISNLEAERDSKIMEIQENTEQMRVQTVAISRQVQQLIEEKRDFATELKGVVASRKLDGALLLYLPFYVVDYLAESKQHHEFYAPVFASSPEGILLKIKKKLWGFSLEARVGILLRQRSKALEKMFSSGLGRRMEEDHELRNRLREKSEQNNILSLSGFKETLAKGMEKLVEEEWVKPEEKDMILQTFAK
jgi:hypothetical protein